VAGEGTRHGTGRRHGPDIFLSIIVVLDFQSNPTTCIRAAGGLYPALPLIDFQACLAGNPRQAHAGTWPRARAVLPLSLLPLSHIPPRVAVYFGRHPLVSLLSVSQMR
jgi:hypothetical protein